MYIVKHLHESSLIHYTNRDIMRTAHAMKQCVPIPGLKRKARQPNIGSRVATW
jgi:hypothetical protein